MARFSSEGYTRNMKLADTVRVTCDPKRLLEDRAVHDAAHLIADGLRRAKRAEPRRKNRKS